MLERLARTTYRRRRSVLVVWIVLLFGGFALSGAIGGAFKTEFKLPGTESQEAFDLLERSSFRNRQIQGQLVFQAEQGIDDPQVQEEIESLLADDRRGGRRPHRRQPVQPRGPAPDRPGRHRVRRAQLRRPVGGGPSRRRRGDQSRGRQGRRRGAHDRVRRRHVRHRPDQRGERSDRRARRHGHPAHRVRVGARDGAADRHRAVRHRHRHRARC